MRGVGGILSRQEHTRRKARHKLSNVKTATVCALMAADMLPVTSISILPDEDMINRHGQDLTLQVWYPSSKPDDDIHLYGDFFESGIADGGDIDCSRTYPIILFSHGKAVGIYSHVKEKLNMGGYK